MLNKRRKFLNRWTTPIKSTYDICDKDKHLNLLNVHEIAIGGRIMLFKDEKEVEYLAEDKIRHFKERK